MTTQGVAKASHTSRAHIPEGRPRCHSCFILGAVMISAVKDTDFLHRVLLRKPRNNDPRSRGRRMTDLSRRLLGQDIYTAKTTSLLLARQPLSTVTTGLTYAERKNNDPDYHIVTTKDEH